MKKFAVLSAVITILLLASLGSFSAGKNNIKEINVFAAASLTESFTEIKKAYEMSNDNTVINLNFAGSQTLKTSLENGGKAGLFVSANIKYMEELREKGFVDDYKVFLHNRLVLIRNKNSAFYAKDLKDLSMDGLKIAVGDKSVPVGDYWEKALSSGIESGLITSDVKEKIDLNIKTRELNVKDVLSKVLLGEVDFGVVYRSDISKENTDKLEEIELDVFKNCDAEYPLAVLKDSHGKDEVQRFYNFLSSPEGKDIFKKYKFTVE